MIELHEGDSFELIKQINDESVKLVMTDVPYPDLNFKGRKEMAHTTSSIQNKQMKEKDTFIVNSQNYYTWFEPLAKEIARVLKPGGSFVTTINSKTDALFYHKFVIWTCDTFNLTYVQDWIWKKSKIIPGKHRNTVRQSFDYIAHFYKGTFEESKTTYDLEAVNDWKKYNGFTNTPINTVFGTGTDSVYRQACKNLDIAHNAKYCSLIPELFIKILTSQNDVILEPFNGSGTTSIVAEKLGRKCIAFEQCHEFNQLAITQYDMLGLKYDFIGGIY